MHDKVVIELLQEIVDLLQQYDCEPAQRVEITLRIELIEPRGTYPQPTGIHICVTG